MSILARLGAVFGKLVGKGSAPAVDLLDTAAYLDDLIESGEATVKKLTTDFSVKAALSDVLYGKFATNPDAAKLNDLYKGYISNQGSHVIGLEHRAPLSALANALTVALTDIRSIRDHYTGLFDDHGPAQIATKDLKIGMAVALGFVEYTQEAITWANDFMIVALGVAQGNPPSTVNFILSDLIAITPDVNTIVGEILHRRGGRSLLASLTDLDAHGRNALLMTGNQTIDKYLADRDFASSDMTYAAGFIRSPVLMIGTYFVDRRRLQMEKLHTQQEFLQSMIASYQRKQANADPNDPELKRLALVESSYRKILGDVQEKLDRMNRHA